MGTTGITGATTVTGTTNINSGTGSTAATNIGATGGTNNVVGSTNITGITNINTRGTAATTIGNAAAGTSVTAGGGSAIVSVANNAASLGVNAIAGDTSTSTLVGATQGTSGSTGIVMRGTNGATESVASLTLTNGIGNVHGVQIYENRSVFSGGANTTTMTLADDGATFRNVQTGGAARVRGVADGSDRYDAVNFGQMTNGIAAATALTAVPMVDVGKRFNFGVGTGHYKGANALALGVSARFGFSRTNSGTVNFGVSGAGEDVAYRAGMGFNF